jgi:hypothetical protein
MKGLFQLFIRIGYALIILGVLSCIFAFFGIQFRGLGTDGFGFYTILFGLGSVGFGFLLSYIIENYKE